MEVVNLGLVDMPEKALMAGHQFRQADVDLIFLHVTTCALSSTVLPVAGEMEIKNAQAMRIMDSFGAGGSFTEYCAMDYRDDLVLKFGELLQMEVVKVCGARNQRKQTL